MEIKYLSKGILFTLRSCCLFYCFFKEFYQYFKFVKGPIELIIHTVHVFTVCSVMKYLCLCILRTN